MGICFLRCLEQECDWKSRKSVIMCKVFSRELMGWDLLMKSLSKEKNVHMSEVRFIVMNNNTPILNVIWISFTIIGIQRYFTRVISKVMFQLIIQWREGKWIKHCLSALPTFSYLVCNAPHLICSFRGEFYLWKGLIILKKNVHELLVFIYNGHTDSLTIPTHVKQICFQDFQIF